MTTQFPPGASGRPEQPSVSLLNGRAGGVIFPIDKLAFPSFHIVTLWGPEDPPTLAFPKSIEEGTTLISGVLEEIPFPVRATVFGFSSGSLEGIFELLEKVPSEPGKSR